jgi:4-azaleucine resistance transporter AzlC
MPDDAWMRGMIEQAVSGASGSPTEDIGAARRDLALASLAFAASGMGFGFVYGLAAREAGFSLIEATSMSVFVLAGAAQFAAVGLIAHGAGWPSIVFLTALLNARHLLYSAAIAPWLGGRPRLERAAMAHVLTDETFALSLAHFQRLGRADVLGFWLAAGIDCLSWPIATAIGVLGGQLIPDPAQFGLDVVFPAAMGGLAVTLATGRQEVAAALAGAVLAVAGGIVVGPAVSIVVGGILAPVAGLMIEREGEPGR